MTGVEKTRLMCDLALAFSRVGVNNANPIIANEPRSLRALALRVKPSK